MDILIILIPLWNDFTCNYFDMGRRIENKKKYTGLTLYNVSPCMREFIEDSAQSQSVHYGRQISITKIISDIIRKEMKELGWECD